MLAEHNLNLELIEQKFFALGDPARFAIVKRLASGPQTAGDLAEPFAISRPAISRHLRVLREAGIARAEVQGRVWWYSLDPATFNDVRNWAEELQEMWAEALQAFKEYVEEQE
jgi:DNA-binding transcriptional ArsR family regulator